jgi:hypothetical protein
MAAGATRKGPFVPLITAASSSASSRAPAASTAFRVRRREHEHSLADARTINELRARVVASVRRAEELELRVDELELAARLRERWEAEITAPGVPRLHLRLLGGGANARLGTARPERGLRSLELLAVLAMHREGLTAEQLALALYGERGKTVTIRAQIHRVRSHLGRRALQTRPYRLADSFDADSLEVARLVAAGHPDQALGAYLGPLLPASDAPAIVEARGLLDESLRRSILTTADPDLLSRWLLHPCGTDDLAAARTLVAVLPVGDPRRAAASASAAAVGRRMSLAAPAPG